MQKVMLASAVTDYNKITWPKFASPKLDGVRAVVVDGVVYSRSGKPIRSKTVQRLFGDSRYNNLDGELIYGSPTAEDVFNKTTSFVMSEDIPDGMSEKEITYYVFDYICDKKPFSSRLDLATYVAKLDHIGCSLDKNMFRPSQIFLIPQILCNSQEDMLEIEGKYLNAGYEGIMLRSVEGMYKHGRATEKSQDLLKVKRFVDYEVKVIGFEELLTNTNPAMINELGYQERSSCKENLVGANTLGALKCITQEGVEFNVGTGFDAATRKHIWGNRDKYVGKLAKIKSFPIGVKNAPRLPVFLGFRDEDDL